MWLTYTRLCHPVNTRLIPATANFMNQARLGVRVSCVWWLMRVLCVYNGAGIWVGTYQIRYTDSIIFYLIYKIKLLIIYIKVRSIRSRTELFQRGPDRTVLDFCPDWNTRMDRNFRKLGPNWTEIIRFGFLVSVRFCSALIYFMYLVSCAQKVNTKFSAQVVYFVFVYFLCRIFKMQS